ncbi:MAG: hypothetical protein ACOYJ6_04430 [Caulobacterales bacterium]|jgi:hypothetical protein
MAPMTWPDLHLAPAILTMLSLWFDAVFRGVREAASLVEQSHFVRALMIIKRISAILRHSFGLLAARLEIKVRRAKSPYPLTPPSSTPVSGGSREVGVRRRLLREYRTGAATAWRSMRACTPPLRVFRCGRRFHYQAVIRCSRTAQSAGSRLATLGVSQKPGCRARPMAAPG